MKNIGREWFKLHKNSLAWITELEFMKDEQIFLEHLLSTHFIDLSTEKLYEITRKLTSKLKEVEHLGDELSKEIQVYNKKIAEVLESDIENPENRLDKEHQMIEKDFESYVLKFKYVKKKIFGIIKEILAHHKQKLLLHKT